MKTRTILILISLSMVGCIGLTGCTQGPSQYDSFRLAQGYAMQQQAQTQAQISAGMRYNPQRSVIMPLHNLNITTIRVIREPK